jgi:lipopolysaccharide transport system permease protein
MIDALRLLRKYRNIIIATTLSDIKARYKGTTFGMAWALIYPLMFLGLYAIIYLMVFRIRLPNYTTFEYILMVFSGLIPFLGFAESLGAGVGSVNANKNLIKNTIFPIELIPVKVVLSSSVTMIVGLIVLLVSLWFNGKFMFSQLLLPVLFILQIFFMIGFIWLLSALNVFFQDLGQIVGVIILFLMLVSPIAYTEEMIPPSLMPMMYPNPLYYMIMLYRGVLVIGEFQLSLFFIFVLITTISFSFGYYVFSRLMPMFADYV